MKVTNPPTGAARQVEVGMVWEEALTNAQGTLQVPRYSTIRVRAADVAVTVTIDGVLAMTMATGEVERFCMGEPDPTTAATPATVVIAGGNAYVQVAREVQKRAN